MPCNQRRFRIVGALIWWLWNPNVLAIAAVSVARRNQFLRCAMCQSCPQIVSLGKIFKFCLGSVYGITIIQSMSQSAIIWRESQFWYTFFIYDISIANLHQFIWGTKFRALAMVTIKFSDFWWGFWKLYPKFRDSSISFEYSLMHYSYHTCNEGTVTSVLWAIAAK